MLFALDLKQFISPMPASQHRVLATQGRRPLPVAGPTRAAGWPGREGCGTREGGGSNRTMAFFLRLGEGEDHGRRPGEIERGIRIGALKAGFV